VSGAATPLPGFSFFRRKKFGERRVRSEQFGGAGTGNSALLSCALADGIRVFARSVRVYTDASLTRCDAATVLKG
jgi:hypothetical protein